MALPRIKSPMTDGVCYRAAPTKGANMAKKKVVRLWSREDHRTLKTMAKDKKGAKKKALKRTVFATRAMAVKRGVSLSMS